MKARRLKLSSKANEFFMNMDGSLPDSLSSVSDLHFSSQIEAA
jgi:hypothetical protein